MTQAELPSTINEALAFAATTFRSKLAYIEAERSLTWSELDGRVEEVAAGLIVLGFDKGDRAAICAENSIDWLVAYLAVVRAGGTGVLIYYDLRRREIEEQVTRPGSRFLFASPSVLDTLREGEDIAGVEHVIVLREASQAEPQEGTSLTALAGLATGAARRELASRTPGQDDLAVVVYTSGTTGGAKGVKLSHRNLIANARAAIEALELTEEDSSLLVLPLHHAMPFIATVLLPPLIGAHFIIENELPRIRHRLQEHRPTIFFGVPALYELMYRNVLARAEAEGRLATLQRLQRWLSRIKRLTGVNLAPLALRSIHKALGGRLRFLVSGGAALNPRTVLDFSSLGLPLLQGWGMTEASPVIAVQRFSARKFRYSNYYESQAGSVGPPLPGVEVKLVDVPEKQISVAESGEGEVLVRGPNVFQGYWQAEDATAEALQDGWLRTGDLGRIDAEGNLYLTGRSKYIIVLDSGEKVYPDEVEDVLAQSELLQDVCIVERASPEGRHRPLVTAVIYPNVEAAQARAGGSAMDTHSLEAMVRAEVDRIGAELAAYKRVSRIELSDEPLPKTALLKVARGQLRESYEFDYRTWLKSGELD